METYQETVIPFCNRLYRYAYRLTHNERDAEDLVQDTLLRSYSRFEQYQPGTSPLAWLLVILRSIFINKYRKKKREGNVVSLEDVSENIDRVVVGGHRELPTSPDDFFFHNTLDSELREALKKLPTHYLDVILLIDMEDLSYREASEILDIPHGTVMSRLHRARKILQGQLQDLARRKGIVKSKVQPISDTKRKGGTGHGA